MSGSSEVCCCARSSIERDRIPEQCLFFPKNQDTSDPLTMALKLSKSQNNLFE